MNNKVNKSGYGVIYLAIAVMFIVSINYAGALGVTPGRTPMDFSAGAERTIGFTVINSQHEKLNLAVYVQGELKEHVSFEGGQKSLIVSMAPDEEQKQLNYKIKLPDSLSPGIHTADVVILQLPEKSEKYDAYVGASVAVVTQVSVSVPIPGKFVEAELNIISNKENGQISFLVPVTNKGEFDIVNAKVVFDIYSKLNEKVASFSSDGVKIESRQRKELVKAWKPEVPAGPYRVVASVIADEQTIKLEKEFLVGGAQLELQQVNVKDFRLGQIAKFEMLVENKWSDVIAGAYALTEVFDKNGRVLSSFKSPTYDLQPQSKAIMVSYWDTAGVKENTYDASVYLRNGERSSQQNLKFKVSQDEIVIIGLGYVISEGKGASGGGYITTILIAVVVVLVLLNLMWFFMLRKFLVKKKAE